MMLGPRSDKCDTVSLHRVDGKDEGEEAGGEG